MVVGPLFTVVVVEATDVGLVVEVVVTVAFGLVVVVPPALDLEHPANDPPTTRVLSSRTAARFDNICSRSPSGLRSLTRFMWAVSPGLTPGTPQVWRVRRRIWRHDDLRPSLATA